MSGYEDVERAIDIDEIGVERIFNGTRHGGASCEVHHVISAFDRRLHRGEVGDANARRSILHRTEEKVDSLPVERSSRTTTS